MGWADDWTAAKKKFEDDTDLKKPAAKGKVLFITWRKGSGLEDAFKDLDKIVDARATWNDASAKEYKKWEDALNDMLKKKAAYLPTLEKSIEDEKKTSGKSDNYRAFKVLKAELEAISTRAEQKYKSAKENWELKKTVKDGIITTIDQALLTLKNLSINLKSGVAKATLFCKQVLQDPTPQNWNSGILTAARDMRQQISNINRYVYADWVKLVMDNKVKELAILDDERVEAQIKKMDLFLHEYGNAIQLASKKSGSTPTDANLEKLGTDNVHFATDATANDVKAGVKHFADIIKWCGEVSAQLAKVH